MTRDVETRATDEDFRFIRDAWDWGDPEASERAFREMLDEADDASEGWRRVLETQIARALGLQREFDAAHDVLEGVQDALGADPFVRVYYLLERGRVLNSSGEAQSALPLFEDAWNRAIDHDFDAAAVDAAHMIAIVKDGAASLDWNRKALELARESDDEAAQKWQGSLLNNIGWAEHESGDFESALETFEEALAYRQKQGAPEPTRVASWCVARTLRSLGRVSEALEMQQDLVKDYPEVDDPYVALELGECLLELGREDDASPHFRSAWESLRDDQWYRDQNPDEFERLRSLAGVD